VRLLIRVSNPHLYDIDVNGRRFLVSFHVFGKMRPKELPGPSITDYTLNIYEKHAIHAIFLNNDMMLDENIFLYGIYHALEDHCKHNIDASPVFAINIIMHVYCTRQVNILKEKVIPRSFNESSDEELPVVMILIGEDVAKENHDEIINEINENFFLEPLDAQIDHGLDAGGRISAIIDSIPALSTQTMKAPSYSHDIEWVTKVLQAKMALFSLNLQLKS